jgi:hypothetical protein
MGYPQIWYRIDKGTGQIAVSNGVNVVRAATGAFKKPNHAIATGRFATPFAIYATGDKLTPEEDKQLEAQESQKAEDEALRWAADGEETVSKGRW